MSKRFSSVAFSAHVFSRTSTSRFVYVLGVLPALYLSCFLLSAAPACAQTEEAAAKAIAAQEASSPSAPDEAWTQLSSSDYAQVTTQTQTAPPQIADTAPASVTTSATTGATSKTSRMLGVIRENVKETFELDPHLKKDLTEGNPALRPIKLIEDYYATGYTPSIEWDRVGGDGTGNAGNPTHVWTTTFQKRGLNLYLAGPVTKHLSGWFQMTPLLLPHHFFQHFEMFQGLANYGTDKTLVQIRGGQGFLWQNDGWGGADRTVTLTSPGVYSAFNGFDPTATSKFIEASATGLNWTTGKIFGYWQPAASTTSDPNILFHRGYGMGFAGEKLIGKTGISGIQTNLTIGNTPVFNARPGIPDQQAAFAAQQQAISSTIQANNDLQTQANQAAQAQYTSEVSSGIDIATASADANAAAQAVIDGAGGFQDPQAAGQAAAQSVTQSTVIGTQSSPFIWWTSWINKSIQDKSGAVRLNPSFGLTAFRVKRFFDDATLPQIASTGYGYTFDLVAIPVKSYWTTVLRYDDFRATDLTHRNAQYTFTVGQALDFHTPNKGRIRVTLDYQIVGQKGMAPSHRFILGFWPIW
jgi:hypothetical protein